MLEIGDIQKDLEEFFRDAETNIRSSFVPFPGYKKLSKTPESSMKAMIDMKQKLWVVSEWLTKVQFKKIALKEILQKIRLGEVGVDLESKKALLSFFNQYMERLRDLESLAIQREQSMIHGITVIRSIQSSATNRKLFDRY